MLEKIVMSKSKTFLAFCFCFLLGTVAGTLEEWNISLTILYGSIFIGAACLIVVWDKKVFRYSVLGLCFAWLGFVRGVLAFPVDDTASVRSQIGRESHILGYVAEEPDVRIDHVRYVIQSSEFSGRILITTNLYPRYRFGEPLEIVCDIKTPKPIGDFRYDMYLAKSRIFAICEHPKISTPNSTMVQSVVQIHGWFETKRIDFLERLLDLKAHVQEKVSILWHEPHASFMAGLLYGYRGGLGDLQELFQKTGVSHIVAISGYNISIVAMVVITFLTYLWIPRKKAFWLTVIGILLFVLFTGASASVFRAGIMGILVLLGKYLGRPSRALNVVLFAAVLMALHNPLVLLWDAGFQLSFAATIGLLFLAPMIGSWFFHLPKQFGFQEACISTAAAILATLPLILFQFGRISLVAFFANILILWIIPPLMFFGFLAVLSSFVFLPLAQVIAWIAWLGLSYILVVVKAFAGLSFASVDVSFPLWAVLFAYGFMIYWILQKQKKLKEDTVQ